MPTYSFACPACDHRFDQVLSIHHTSLPACTACGGEVRKVIGNVAVTFKGSGFYRTDSRAGASSGSSTGASTSSSAPAAATSAPAPAAASTPASGASAPTKSTD